MNRPFGRPRSRFAHPEVPELVTPQSGSEQVHSIRWVHNRCPTCNSKEITTYRTEHVGEVTVRWHACKACNGKFKSSDDGKG